MERIQVVIWVLCAALMICFVAYYFSVANDCDKRGGVVVDAFGLPTCVAAPPK